MSRVGLHLAAEHPLAGVAAQHCTEHAAPLVGGVACGSCWERAIRDDERFVVESDLERETVAEPDLVDVIAVERACAGERIPLTDAELSAAIRRLRRAGWSKNAIAERLDAPERIVVREAAAVHRGHLRVRRTQSGVAA